MAALTRSGARKASEIVIVTFRTLHFSRSGDAVGSATSWKGLQISLNRISPPVFFFPII